MVADVSEGVGPARAEPTVFYSNRQLSETSMTLFLRAIGRRRRSRPPSPRCIGSTPNLAVSRIQTFDDAIADSLARERLSALVFGAFALCALLLTSLGLYGLLSFLVTERTKSSAFGSPSARMSDG